MIAFIRNGDFLAKAYDEGDDWRITHPQGDAWCSVWVADRRGSLERAFRVACERNGVAFDPADILYA